MCINALSIDADHIMIGWGSPKGAAGGEEKIPYLRHKEMLDNTYGRIGSGYNVLYNAGIDSYSLII